MEELTSIIQKKQSNLCIGLDIKQENKLEIAKQIIDETSDFAAAYKPNRQYWLGYDFRTMKTLNDYIHKKGCFSIIDHKLSDIGSSNYQALRHSKSEGFDLITISPYPGNLKEMLDFAREIDIGIISLIMMSNPEASWMTESPYVKWAKIADRYQSNVVIGTTNHVSEEIISSIADVFKSGLVLAPGIGMQGGKIDSLVRHFGKRVLFNVSRGVSEQPNYREAAKMYHEMVNKAFE